MPSPPRAPRPTGTVRCPLLMALLVCLATACAVGLADPPESKEAGASKVPAADPKLTADDNLTCVRTAIETEAGWYAIARPCKRLAESGDLRVIPTLIGLMDADNSEDSIYGIGRFGLGPLTGVDYDEVHHGRWWRKWWAVNKHHFRHEVQEMPIPEFPLTEHGKRFAASPPPPDSIVLNPTADDYLARIQTAIHSGDWRSAGVPCQRLAKLGDPRAIPKLIGLMDSDNSKPVIHVLNMEALQPLTGVTYDPDAQHGRWWRKWWAENKMRFPKDVQDTAIPTYPLTKHGTQFAAHPPSPDSIVLEPTADDYLARIKTAIETGDHDAIDMPCRILSELGDERVIPRLIGLMDADNSPIVVKEIGPTLEWLTGVADHSSRNGTWWREWWNVSKSKFPDDVRGIEIPNYPKTEHGKRFAERIEGQPVILDPTLDELLALIGREVKEEGKNVDETAAWIASYENPRAIEPLINLIVEDSTGQLDKSIGSELKRLAEVDVSGVPDAGWWEDWWERNRDEINRRIAQTDEPPTGNLHVPNHRLPLPQAEDVREIPAADTLVNGDARKRYVLIGPKENAQQPRDGWSLLIVLPGGSGGPGFHPFVKRIYKNVLSERYLAVQVIAPEWNQRQARQLVWPTENSRFGGVEFSSEEFLHAVISDVRDVYPLDDRFIFTLSWSSSGPAAYAASLRPNTQIKGSLVAMSVFQPAQLPSLDAAKNQCYFILHSPHDFINISQARSAEQLLREHGARVKLKTYDGGHGWHDDPYGKMKQGIEWLEQTR